jgi:NIMA-interacting peptidyl-prolyl cis-trans isomerase 1
VVGGGDLTDRHRREREGGGGDAPASSSSSAPASAEPREVRVLHILRKHRDSRNPSSWRSPKVTCTKERAMSDLRELMSILEGAAANSDDPNELRATFEELARTESDCSSAKRGGDLGFFGRKKMQPAFEKASFGLGVGGMSDVVDTSSGVHVILRLA